MSTRSWHLITSWEEFRVLWSETLTGLSTKWFVWSRFWAWALLPHSTKKEPSVSLLILFRLLAITWKPFWIAKGDSFCKGRSSFADLTIINFGHFFFSLFEKISFSESVSVSSSHPLFMYLCFDAMLCSIMICYILSPPTTESNKGMHTSRNSSKCAPGLKM